MWELTSSQKETLKAVLRILPPRDQAVLSMRFGLDDDQPLTQEQVGMYFNISRTRVGQIEARALRRLQQTKR
jgi:RNA polymerase primary sigma factor